MKAGFFRRLGAFLIDSFIISLFLTIITFGFETDSSLQKQASDLTESYLKEEISIEEYTDKANTLNYELLKDNVWINGISAAIYVGYFVIFAYLNKGQTLGKKLVKIRTVGKDNKPVTFGNMLVRSLFIYGIFSSIYSAIFVNILGKNNFNMIGSAITFVEGLFLTVSFFMILYRKDKRGLHDMMAGTSVISEVK